MPKNKHPVAGDPRFLVTTADESTWIFSKPVLFLGEWCRLHERKHVWSEMDAEVAKPYYPNLVLCDDAMKMVEKSVKYLLHELTASLNSFHQTNHSERYWYIVLGHWLKRYVSVIYNRYHTLEQAFKLYAINETTFVNAPDYYLAVKCSNAFIWTTCLNDEWNQVLYTKMISFWNISGIQLRQKEVKSNKTESSFKGQENNNLKTRFLSIIKSKVLPAFSRDTDAFISASYLPIHMELALQTLFFQSPQFWESPPLAKLNLDTALRRHFKVEFEKFQGFERFVRQFLPEMIPICFLEGHKILEKQVNELPWPSKPKFIFTSNRFDVDEIFKIWLASKVEEGFIYFTGQHGNNYGTLKGIEDAPELIASDKFFTWGWTHGVKKHIPSFNFKLAGKKEKSKLAGNGLLFLQLRPPLRLTITDDYQRFETYFKEQIQFVGALPSAIKNELTIRIHPASIYFNWNEEQRWKEYFVDIQVDKSSQSIFKQTLKSKLVIHSYDSTGILETLSLNIPTLCFWQDGLTHLLPKAKPFYKLLQKAGILADNPVHAAELVTKYWLDMEGWWFSQVVQDARKAFCYEYSRMSDEPVKSLKQLFDTTLEDIRHK